MKLENQNFRRKIITDSPPPKLLLSSVQNDECEV
jgi:hypothetical protein